MTGKPRQGRAGRRLRLLVGLSLALITAAGVPSAPAVADTLTSTDAHTTAGTSFGGVAISGEQIVAHLNRSIGGLACPGAGVDLATHDAVRL